MNNETNSDNPINFIPKASLEASHLTKSLFPKRSADEIEKLRKAPILFSFHFFDSSDKLFNCGNTDSGWFLHLLENVREISKITKMEFWKQRQHYDIHSIDWNKKKLTRKRFSIPDHIWEKIDSADMVQFRLSTSNGRVHGFWIYNTFYVVWLDPHHQLDPMEGFEPPTEYNAPLRPYEQLMVVNEQLQTQVNEWIQKYEKLDKEVTIILQDLEDCEKRNGKI